MGSAAATRTDDLAQQKALISALQRPECYPHSVGQVQVIETHVSWVLLTGQLAYKIKKPVNFGFLDFSTLAQREHFCREELRLNRRFSDQLYLDVVAIGGTLEHPRLVGAMEPPVLEYAVKMQQFPEGQLLSDYAERGELTIAMTEQIARQMAGFHQRAGTGAAPPDDFGSPQSICRAAQGNFDALQAQVPLYSEEIEQRDQVRAWSEAQWRRLRPIFAARAATSVRECHGDLHLGNIAWLDDQPVFFDCIEFSAQFRWIDTISELAFLMMDLEQRDLPELSGALLNSYLQSTGDYGGLAVLQFYRAYRAMVRAKVCRLQLAQQGDQTPALLTQYRHYLGLAVNYTQESQPVMLITHGFSGSGKSFVARQLARSLQAVHLQADVERKRLAGLDAHAQSQSGVGQGIYTKEFTERTYTALWHGANYALNAGFSVIVDATFLSKSCREHFKNLASQHTAPFLIVVCRAPEQILEKRLAQRATTETDPSEADRHVLALQKEHYRPLDTQEWVYALTVDTDRPQALKQLQRSVEALFNYT